MHAAGVRSVFAWTLVPGVLAAILHCHARERAARTNRSRTPDCGAVMQSLPGEFKEYLVGVGLAGIGDFSNTLLILWATQAWTPRLGLAAAASRAMLFYVGYNVVYTHHLLHRRIAGRPLAQALGAGHRL